MHNKTVYSIYNYVDLSSKLSKKQVSIEKKNHEPCTQLVWVQFTYWLLYTTSLHNNENDLQWKIIYT
jgi:hypothetical protein